MMTSSSLVRVSVLRCSLICLALGGWAGLAVAGPAGLDPDNNGLYDDAERKVLLDEFLKTSPELSQIIRYNSAPIYKAKSNDVLDFSEGEQVKVEGAAEEAGVVNFDTDGDGKVTVLEMNKGHEPLSMLMPPSFLQSGARIPWGIDIFPEWISSAYFPEDVEVGAVTSIVARGNMKGDGVAVEEAHQPWKVEGEGVVFAANSGQHLTLPQQRDARWNYRWCILTFRIDAATGADSETVLVDINKGTTSSMSSPKIWYDKVKGLSVQYVGSAGEGLDRRVLTAKNVVADGKTWNVLVSGMRQGQAFASVNGVPAESETKQPPRFSGEWPKAEASFIGDPSTGNMAWAFDALVFGLSEPSEAMVRKMTGWAAHRRGFAANLPEGHPYRTERPIVDAEDFPTRYVHDDVTWNEWGRKVKDKTFTRANTGGPRVVPAGFERVFYDDFRADRVARSTAGDGDLWVGPGFNIAVGGAAPLVTPGMKPNPYIYDAEKKQLTLAAILDERKKNWRGSAIYTVNDMGWGWTWKGPKIFRIRCMFPAVPQKELAPVLFPAFWSYGTDHLFWRTGNRIETDYFEFDGKNGAYLNGLSTHFHYPYLKGNIHARNPGSYQRYKVYGADMKKPETNFPDGFHIWDGKFHTWEFVMDKDMTYINVTIPQPNGTDKWVEVCRAPTAATYLQRVNLQLDYAFHGKGAVPKDGKRQDFVVDWIEVLQRTDQVEMVPKPPFTARPELSGEVKAGSTITCDPKLEGVTDVRYYWFAGGYPLTYGPENTFTITAAEAGKPIRCMVQAVGARDQPEAWSAVLQ